MSKEEKVSRLLCRVGKKVAKFQTHPLSLPVRPKRRVSVPDDLEGTSNILSASEDFYTASVELYDLFCQGKCCAQQLPTTVS